MTSEATSSATGDGAVLAAGLVDMLEGMFNDAQWLILLGVILVGMAFVIMTWMRTRSLVPTLGALLLGALVAYGVSSFDWFAERIGDDVERYDTEDNNADTSFDRPGAG